MTGSMATQSGVALITALIVVALVTVITVSATASQQLELRRTANVLDNDRAYLFALGAEAWAIQVLAKDAKDNQIDHLKEDWTTVIANLPVEGATVSGRGADMQGRFNLNNLVDSAGQHSEVDARLFQRLLSVLEIAPELADAVIDWLDADIDVTLPGGAEDSAYLAMKRPYRAANRRFESPSELMLVSGFDRAIYQKLEPYISALPAHGVAVNVNTAPPEVLRMLGEGITAADAKELSATRADNPFDDSEEFLSQPVLQDKKPEIVTDRASVSSQYFMVYAETRFGHGRAQLFSLLQRAEGNSGKVAVVSRGQGTY
ncbi:MAG: proteinral secretion pathway protein K [Gammaproteobacteria bacterium]|nr:MAG: proteinral secretion pathway protein K [Gammaproteobacteria bacterium]TND02458.1 MAG: proteinral secretion pathway protein K [Gammaproteobacteria bacterium]